MISYKNITIIGTSHISSESVREVRETIRETFPDLVAIELDRRRFEALMSKKSKTSIKDIKKFGLKGFLINVVGAYFEKKLGKLTGVAPGTEMKTAVIEAKRINAKIALIDQDITITIRKLAKVPFKEKFFIIIDSIKNIFKKDKIKFNLKKVPSKKKISQLINMVKKYPNLYKVLIDDRNKYMAKNLHKLMSEYEVIIAVVGAGHEDDIIKELKNENNKKRD